MTSRMNFVSKLIVLLGLFVVSLPQTVDAQRPSLGELQTQIDGLLIGGVDFSEVSFGPDCSIGICPGFSGLSEKDPNGLRLLGQDLNGCILRFGPTDDCSIGIDPTREGLIFRDIGCFVFENPDPSQQTELQVQDGLVRFGDQCTLGIDPDSTGLVLSDPTGLRLRNLGSSGKDGVGRIIFGGPTDDCSIEAGSTDAGMRLLDPHGVSIENPFGLPPSLLLSGGTIRFGDECTIGIDPTAEGFVINDPSGIRIRGIGSMGQDGVNRISFGGPTDDCSIQALPDQGLRFRDPNGFVFDNPNGLPDLSLIGGTMRFGDECTLGVDPNLSGIVLSDPAGLRVRNLGSSGKDGVSRIVFGPTDDCSISVDPASPDAGMRLRDVRPFIFETPFGQGDAIVRVEGTLFANEVIQLSRGDLKENVRTIPDPIETVKKLRGVQFDWKANAKRLQPGQSSSDIGFIAEEVADVISEAAVYDASGENAQGVKYSNLVALVVESVKAQQTQIETQQKLIEELKQEIEQLRQTR